MDKQFKHGDGDFIYLGPRRRLFTTSAALQQLHAWLSLQPGPSLIEAEQGVYQRNRKLGTVIYEIYIDASPVESSKPS